MFVICIFVQNGVLCIERLTKQQQKTRAQHKSVHHAFVQPFSTPEVVFDVEMEFLYILK